MSKDLFIAAHAEAMERYLEEHPNADLEDAYERTVDEAAIGMRDMMADRIDAARDAWKDAQ